MSEPQHSDSEPRGSEPSDAAAAPPSGARAGGRPVLPDVIGLLATGLVLSGILEILLPRALGPIRLGLVLDVGVVAVAAGGLALAVWALDRISLGHAALVGVGAYTAAAVGYYGHVHAFGTVHHQGALTLALFAGALAAGTVASAAVGALIALPTARAHPLALPAAMLLLGEGLRLVLLGTHDVLADATTIRSARLVTLATSLGGETGFTSAPLLASPLSVGAALAVLWAAALAVKRAPRPASLRGRVGVFALGAALAGLGGGLLAHSVGAVHRPEAFGLGPSLELLAVALAGGWGSVSGASLVAILAVLLREVPGVAEHRLALYGVVVVLLLGLRARGLGPRSWEVWDLWSRRAG